MSGDLKTHAHRDAMLEAFAAELTLAAYRVALRTTKQGAWLDLQLDLWRVLADKVKTWGSELSGTPTAGDAGAVQRGRVP
jgi:hypothetical protein